MEFLHICTTLLTIFVYMDWTMASEQHPCPKINLQNGRVRERSKGRLASFRCKKNFELVGVKFVICLDSGQWSQQIPVCVGTTCNKPDDVPNLIVDELYKGGVLKFTCEAGLTRSGPEKIMCDGNKWSDQPPTCKKDLNMSCDFEDQGLCGWSHDFEDDFDWIWNKGETPTAETGPRFDHTTNTSEGHYLYMEASAPQTNGKKTRIVSPAYEPKDNLCLEFFYHMFGPEGAGEVGDLDVYVKPSSLKTTMLDASYNVFHSNGNHGDQWLRAEVKVPKQAGTFQIVFEGTRRKSWSGDIAIDDVKLRDCLQETSTKAMPNNDNSDKDVDDGGNDPGQSLTEKTTLIGRPTTSKAPDSMTTKTVKTSTDEVSVSSTQLTTTLQPSKVTKKPETTAALTSVPSSALISSTRPETPSTSTRTTLRVTSPLTTETTTRPTTTPDTTTVAQTSPSTVTSTTTTTTATTAATTTPTTATTRPTTATTIPTTVTTTTTATTTRPTTAPTKPTTATTTTTVTETQKTTIPTTVTTPTTVTITSTAQTLTTTTAPTKSTTNFATLKSTSVTENRVESTVNKTPSPISIESTDPTKQSISSTNENSNNEVTTTQIVPTATDKPDVQSVTDDHKKETDRNNTDNYDYNYEGKSNNNEEDTDDDDDDNTNSDDENSDKDNTYEEKSDTSESDYSDINSKDETDNDPNFINVPERNDSHSWVDNSDQNNSEDYPSTTISAAKETVKSRISVDGNTPRTGHVKDSSPSTKELIPMIVGVAAAVLVAAVVISVLAWAWARNQRRKQQKDEEDQMNIITEYVETNLSI